MTDSNSDGGEQRLHGIYAALITPVDDRGRPDPALLADLTDFVVGRGVDGLCIGGGTAEYPHFSLESRKLIVGEIARHLDSRIPFVTAVGAPTFHDVLELGEHALECGSSALLLPMPFFYHYDQEDLAAYVREAVRSLGAPCLLYNLPSFTNTLEPKTSLSLLRSQPDLFGLKDSSGDREALSLLQNARRDTPFSLMCGSDRLLFEALETGWDGGISGIASCCPEVIVAVYRHYRAGRKDAARRCQQLLDMLVGMVGRMPFPWSIRVAADVRGLRNGPLPYPPSNQRRAQIASLREEYDKWFEEHLDTALLGNALDPD